MLQIFDKSGTAITIDTNKSIASGGEGTIYEHPKSSSKVIKIYHAARDLKLESSLLELNKLPAEFIKPDIIYYDRAGRVIGFSMKYVNLNTHHLLKKLFNNTYCIQHNIDRAFKYKVYCNLKNAVQAAHSMGIVIGDLNPYNILVAKNGDVVMLDVDSYGTSAKPHNGILLEDIRDWVQHPKVDRTTDQYAFDVLTFWLFTLVHPFRGDYPMHKTLEERVCKKSSVLSKLNITMPKCYQPFTNTTVIDQFFDVFQNSKRFIVDLTGQPVMVSSVSSPVIVDSSTLFIRKIDDGITNIVCSAGIMGYFKSDIWHVVNVSSYGTFNKIATISQCTDVYVGSNRFVYVKNGKLWHEGVELTNAIVPQSKVYSEPGTIFIGDDDYQLTMSIDHIMSNQILVNRGPMYMKSVSIGDGVIQTIGNDKWLVIFSGHNFNIVKSGLNLKNFYRRGDYVILEHIDAGKIRYTLAKITGLKLELGCDLSEFKYFDVKSGFIFIPQDGKIDMISPANNWKVVSSIECPVCSVDSKIFHTGAGMIIQTDDSVYLVNKRQ